MTTPSSTSNKQSAHHRSSAYLDDAYGEGFADGRASMAESVAEQLLDQMNDEEISRLTGLTTDTIQTLRQPTESTASAPVTSAETTSNDHSRFRLIRETPTPDTAFVEPNFVRLIREVKKLTQAELAQKLGVHERTVGVWETAAKPVRVRTATYNKLITLSKTHVDSDAMLDASARCQPESRPRRLC